MQDTQKFHIGNFIVERFKNIFKSERYWKIMEYLSSPAFDAQSMMGTLPIQHYVSEALDNHAKGIVKIKKIMEKNQCMLISFNLLCGK